MTKCANTVFSSSNPTLDLPLMVWGLYFYFFSCTISFSSVLSPRFGIALFYTNTFSLSFTFALYPCAWLVITFLGSAFGTIGKF
jgi:hypothetical protein